MDLIRAWPNPWPKAWILVWGNPENLRTENPDVYVYTWRDRV